MHIINGFCDTSETVNRMFDAIEMITNHSCKLPDLRRSIRVLCNLVLGTGEVSVPSQVAEWIGPVVMGHLSKGFHISYKLTQEDLGIAAEVIATALSQPDYINTPKAHRKRKIHFAFSKAFGRERWWRLIESSFSFLLKKKGLTP